MKPVTPVPKAVASGKGDLIIPDSRSYFDSVWFRFSENLPEGIERRLRKAGRGNVYLRRNAPNAYLPDYPCYLALHQPTKRQLLAIWDVCKKHSKLPRITQVHVKLEIPSDNPSQLREWIDQRIIKPNHRSGYVLRFKNTRYTGKKSAKSQIVTYDNKLSKIDQGPSVQIEWRANGTKSVKRIGITGFSDLESFDFGRFWQSKFLIQEPSKKLLGRYYLKKQGINVDKYKEGCTGAILMALWSDKEETSAAEWVKIILREELPAYRIMKRVGIESRVKSALGVDNHC